MSQRIKQFVCNLMGLFAWKNSINFSICKLFKAFKQSYQILTNAFSHCSHLDIYISQKTGSVCSEFVRPISNEPRGQTYQFFDLKIQIYYTHFSSIFCRNCQIYCFLHTVTAVPMSWNVRVLIWPNKMTQSNGFENSYHK